MEKYRRATMQDLPVLNTISWQSKAHWGYPREWMERWKPDLIVTENQFHTQHILVVEIDKKVIGFSSIVEKEEKYEILHLWVLPEFIGKGYGKGLLNATIESFVHESKPIEVEADPNAEAFYKSQGFTTNDQVESYPKGRTLPVMKRLFPESETGENSFVNIREAHYVGDWLLEQWLTSTFSGFILRNPQGSPPENYCSHTMY